MTDNPAEFDDVINKPSRYTGDLKHWIDFAPDGSYEHDITADQVEALMNAMRDASLSASEAASAFYELGASDFDIVPKAKG